MGLRQRRKRRAVQNSFFLSTGIQDRQYGKKRRNQAVASGNHRIIVDKETAEYQNQLHRPREGRFFQHQPGRHRHECQADKPHTGKRHPKLRKRHQDQIPETGMPLVAELGKQAAQAQILRNLPGLGLISPVFVAGKQEQINPHIGKKGQYRPVHPDSLFPIRVLLSCSLHCF